MVARINHDIAVLRGARAHRINLNSDEVVMLILALATSVRYCAAPSDDSYALALRLRKGYESPWLRSLFFPEELRAPEVKP
jgi:hypothetical protein